MQNLHQLRRHLRCIMPQPQLSNTSCWKDSLSSGETWIAQFTHVALDCWWRWAGPEQRHLPLESQLDLQGVRRVCEARAAVRWELPAAETRAQHVLNPQNSMNGTHSHTSTLASQKRCCSSSGLDTINRWATLDPLSRFFGLWCFLL